MGLRLCVDKPHDESGADEDEAEAKGGVSSQVKWKQALSIRAADSIVEA